MARRKLKPFVRCKDCSYRGRYLAPGFLSSEESICKLFSGPDILPVELDDGCTFGKRGEPGLAIRQYDVIIGDHAAVNGWW